MEQEKRLTLGIALYFARLITIFSSICSPIHELIPAICFCFFNTEGLLDLWNFLALKMWVRVVCFLLWQCVCLLSLFIQKCTYVLSFDPRRLPSFRGKLPLELKTGFDLDVRGIGNISFKAPCLSFDSRRSIHAFDARVAATRMLLGKLYQGKAKKYENISSC